MFTSMKVWPPMHLPCLSHVAIGATILWLNIGGASAQVIVEHDASGGLTRIRGTSVEAPTLVRGPQSVLARPGRNAAFSVVSAGAARLGYQWFFNSIAIAGATR